MYTNQSIRRIALSMLAVGMLISFAITAVAGDLEPPAPPAPTMKTLDEVEPRIPIPASATPVASFAINSPGSYYLTGDRRSSMNGIEVNADNVTIDLMGHSLIGQGVGAYSGIYMDGRSNVEIKNGTIRNFGNHGIHENSKASGKNHRVLNVRLMGNVLHGVYIRGQKSVVKDCVAAENGGVGIDVLSKSTIVDNTACANGGDGIYSYSSLIKNNNVHENGGAGIHAFAGNSRIEGNHITGDNGVGLQIDSSGNYVNDNTVRGNGDNYIIAADNQVNLLLCEVPDTINFACTVKFAGSLTTTGHGLIVNADNVIIDLAGHSLTGPGSGTTYGTYGIYMDGRSNVEIKNGTIRNFGGAGITEQSADGNNHRVINVRVIDNGQALGAYSGIFLMGSNNLVKDCIVDTNNGDGISVYGKGSRIIGNTCLYNSYKGIYAVLDNSVTGNTCNNNGDDGIYVGTGSSVTDNTCFGNSDDGIYVGTGSSVIGNTARYNDKWGIYLGGNNLVDQNSATNNNQSGGAFGNMNTSATSTFGTNHAP